MVLQGQQISVQGQQVAQTADGQTIVYQPVNADGTVLQQGKLAPAPSSRLPCFRSASSAPQAGVGLFSYVFTEEPC